MTAIKRAVSQLAEVNSLLSGLQTSPPSGVKSLVIDGSSITINQVVTNLKEVQTLDQAPVDTRAKWKAASAAAKAEAKANGAMITKVRKALIMAYGTDTAGLAACGIVVGVRAPRTGAENTIAAARAAETRKVNGTGKKQPAPQASVTVTDETGQVIGQPSASVAPAAAPAPGANAAPAATAPASAEPAQAGGAAPAAGK